MITMFSTCGGSSGSCGRAALCLLCKQAARKLLDQANDGRWAHVEAALAECPRLVNYQPENDEISAVEPTVSAARAQSVKDTPESRKRRINYALIHWAAASGDPQLVKRILAVPGADPRITTRGGQRASLVATAEAERAREVETKAEAAEAKADAEAQVATTPQAKAEAEARGFRAAEERARAKRQRRDLEKAAVLCCRAEEAVVPQQRASPATAPQPQLTTKEVAMAQGARAAAQYLEVGGQRRPMVPRAENLCFM